MRPDATTVFKEIILHRLKLRAQGAVSAYALSQAECHAEMDYVAQRLVATVDAEILVDHRGEPKVYEIQEPWVYNGWQDQLLHSLPPESIRYRFLHYFLERHPQMRRVRHIITVRVSDTFPESTLALADTLGSPRARVQFLYESDREEKYRA